MRYKFSMGLLILGMAILAMAATAIAQETVAPFLRSTAPGPAPKPPPQAFPLHGYLSTHYVSRSTTGESDEDLYQYADLTYGEPGQSRISAEIFLRVSADLGANETNRRFPVFRDLADTTGVQVDSRVYLAYLDVNRAGPMQLLRLGRQEMFETPVFLYFDGARFETTEATPLKLKLGLYGGVPLHDLYEFNHSGQGSLYGAFVQSRPWTGARLQFHYTHVQDASIYGDLADNFYGVSFRQNISPRFQFHALYTRLNDRDRDLRVQLRLFTPETDSALTVSYYELMEAQTFSNFEFDPYYVSLLTLEPYREAGVWLHQGLGKHLGVDAGYYSRALKKPDDASTANHEFSRYFVTVYVIPGEGLIFSGTGEVWDNQESGLNLTTGGLDLTYRLDRRFRASAGTYYSLFRYDLESNSERQQDRTYYLKVRWGITNYFRLDVGYEYEESVIDNFQTWKVGLNFIF